MLNGRSVLLIGNSEESIGLTFAALRDAKSSVTTATSIKKAIALITAIKFDFVLAEFPLIDNGHLTVAKTSIQKQPTTILIFFRDSESASEIHTEDRYFKVVPQAGILNILQEPSKSIALASRWKCEEVRRLH